MSDVEKVHPDEEFYDDDDDNEINNKNENDDIDDDNNYSYDGTNNRNRIIIINKKLKNNKLNNCGINDNGNKNNHNNSIIINNNKNNSNINKGRYCLNIFIKIAFSTPGLVVLVIAYSIMGAFIFPMLEAPRELSNIAAIARSREDCLKELWTITEKLNVLYEKNWTMLVHEQLRRFEGSIVAATRNGLNTIDLDRSTRWSFSEALLYSVTVITTIGHGNLTPKTSSGKMVTIIYALIGVPLMLMCLSNLGGLLAEALQCTYSKLCCTRRKRKRRKQCDKEKSTSNHHHHHNHHHHKSNSYEGQSYEMDCNICKYDAVSAETKLHGYDYVEISDREDSCQLLHSSPSKLNHHTSSPCMQIKSSHHPILKQYSSLKSSSLSSVETSPIKQHQQHHQQQQQHHHLHHQQQQQQQHPPQYYPMATLNYRNNMNSSSSSPCRNITSTILPPPPLNDSNISNIGQQQQQQQMSSNPTATTTIYFPTIQPTGSSAGSGGGNNHLPCSSAIHYTNQPIVKYHTISLHHHHHHHQQSQQQQQQQQQQQHHHQLPNSPNKAMMTTNNHPHTATVHGIRRGKFVPKPMPQEINMLLAENAPSNGSTINSGNSSVGGASGGIIVGGNSCSTIINCSELHHQSTNENTSVVDIMEDEEENEQNRMGCPHGTPSRIPLISSKSSNKNHNSVDIEQDPCDGNDLDDTNNKQKLKTASSIASTTTTTTITENITNLNSTSTVQVPITIVLLILISYICLGTIIFAFWENWSFIDGAYFCFVTLSTIGYGDFIPQKTFNGPDIQLFACCAYLLLGLVLVAMSFSVLETQLMWKCRKIAVRLKLAKD